MKTRIKDIARLSQVSVGTVDRVIHNRGEVSERTRKKVEMIIKELNYQPDILARTLATKKTYLFAVIMPVSANGNDFWHAPNVGIDKAFEEINAFGVSILRFCYDQFDKNSFLKMSEELLIEKPDAILFAPIFPAESVVFIEKCKKSGISLLLFNSAIDDLNNVDYLGQDARQSGYLSARLMTYGIYPEGDILILNLAGRKENHNHILRRERGFRKYFAENTVPVFDLHTLTLDQPSDDVLFEELNERFSRHRLKGIFVTNSRVYRVASFLIKYNIKNIRLIGYDLIPGNIKYLKMGIIDFLISQKPEEQGYRGIMTLFNKIILNRQTEKMQYIPIDIISRDNIDFYKYR